MTSAVEVTYHCINGEWRLISKKEKRIILRGDPMFYIEKPPPHKRLKEKQNGHICYIGQGDFIQPVTPQQMEAYTENDVEWGYAQQAEWLEKNAMDRNN